MCTNDYMWKQLRVASKCTGDTFKERAHILLIIYEESFKLSNEQIYSKGRINPYSQPLVLFRFVHKQLKGELNHLQFFVLP